MAKRRMYTTGAYLCDQAQVRRIRAAVGIASSLLIGIWPVTGQQSTPLNVRSGEQGMLLAVHVVLHALLATSRGPGLHHGCFRASRTVPLAVHTAGHCSKRMQLHIKIQ